MKSLIKEKCTNFNEVQTVQTMIKTNFIDINNDLNKNITNGKGVRYSDGVKKFALYYYSAREYFYLRTYLTLPHPATLPKF